MGCSATKIVAPVDFLAHIRAASLFKGLSNSDLAPFATAAQRRQLSKGQTLYLQDDKADWFYLVVHGWIKLFRETLEGSEAVLDILTSGHIFGETSIFEDGRYSYAVQAVENTEVIAMPTRILKDKIQSGGQLALNMLSSMSRHRVQQHREIEHLNLQNAPQRIGCFLLRLCPIKATGNITIHLPYDKTLIASRLGMKAETFSRALAKLREETGIKIQGSAVHIGDLQELVTYTCSHCSTSFPCDDLK